MYVPVSRIWTEAYLITASCSSSKSSLFFNFSSYSRWSFNQRRFLLLFQHSFWPDESYLSYVQGKVIFLPNLLSSFRKNLDSEYLVLAPNTPFCSCSLIFLWLFWTKFIRFNFNNNMIISKFIFLQQKLIRENNQVIKFTAP